MEAELAEKSSTFLHKMYSEYKDLYNTIQLPMLGFSDALQLEPASHRNLEWLLARLKKKSYIT